MVLRPTPRAGYFQVVGEAYIPGLINGEISQKIERKYLKLVMLV